MRLLTHNIAFERGGGNVFGDLDLPDAEENKTKLVLALRLNERIKALSLKQAEVAKRLGIAQPSVSALVDYRLDNFSSEKLLEFFNPLDFAVDVLIRPVAVDCLNQFQVANLVIDRAAHSNQILPVTKKFTLLSSLTS